ncbi:SMI1/KNR4 family protein [Salinithrix halophila]|uniref:SMI1/KNR4 family protein n=1 Tax=Salinithrix halophila TaxID=1485204 RepID=A0ABV8JP63_9BACL
MIKFEGINMSDCLVNETLTALKKRLVNQEIEVQGERGFLYKVEFEFNPPASDSKIREFEKNNNITLPVDYKQFLLMHNGAVLFEPWFGGGFELHSLWRIIDSKLEGMPEEWFPIGYQDGGQLFIDTSVANENYLIWLDSSILEDAKYLNMNFEAWLDRFVVAQGAKFWEWE